MRILILEDDVLVAMHLEEELRAAGHEVVGPATAILDAHGLIERADIDFALLDANIEGEAPVSVAEELVRRNIPFAYVTGYDESQIRSTLPRAPLLSKPVEKRALGKLLGDPAD